MSIYLDHNASSPLRPEARVAVEAAMDALNPSSVHREGQKARGLIERARIQVANGLGARAADILFCSGATEAINHAIHSAMKSGRTRILRSAVEHEAVSAAIAAHGATGETCPVDANGIVDLTRLTEMLSGGAEDVLLIVMAANNETGVLQPIAEIVRIAHEAGAVVQVDASQIVGRLPFDVAALDIDMAAVSAHKLGGPKGAGALYARSGSKLSPLIAGGGQETYRRGGTENLMGIAGFGASVEAAMANLDEEAGRIAALRDELEATLAEISPEVVIFAKDAPRLPNTCAFAIPGWPAETLLIALDLAGVATSAGSACSSGKLGPSHVLAAMGVEDNIAKRVLRLSLGWSSTRDDITQFGQALAKILQQRARASAAA